MTDPFEALGLPRKFALAPGELDARVRELQRVLHPDRHTQASPSERRAALSRAVTVNEAYRTLRDDLSRAEALLRARGVPTEAGPSGEPAFLLEVMELREALADAKARHDREALTRLGDGVRRDAQKARDEIAAALDERDRPAEAAAPLARLRYYRRFLDEHEVALEALAAG